jgi:hypothetical protein
VELPVKHIFLVGALGALLVAAACDKNPVDPGQGSQLVIHAPLPRGILYLNDTVRVKLMQVRGTDTVLLSPLGVTWTTENASVVKVAGSLLEGVGHGTAVITARQGSGSASLRVRVQGTLHRDPVRAPTTWGLAGSPHVLETRLTVAGERDPATLTVEPGVLVLFRRGASLAVGDGGAGSLQAGGPGLPTRFEAEDTLAAAGSWSGVELRGAGSSRLQNVLLQQCGAPMPAFWPYPGCLMVRGTGTAGVPAVQLVDVRIRRAQSFGFVVEEEARIGAGSARLSVEEVDGYAGYYPASELPRFPYGGTFANLAKPLVILKGGVISEDAEWRDLGIPWLLATEMTVGGPAVPVLTLAPGLEVRGDYPSRILVGAEAPGRLLAGAPGGAPVRLLEGQWTGAGGWRGLHFGPAAGPSSLTGVHVDGCIPDCLRIEGDGAARRPVLQVVDVRITNARARGVSLAGGGRFADGSRDLVITGAAHAPLWVTVDAVAGIPAGAYTGNGDDRIYVYGGELREDAVWRDPGLPYWVIEGVGVEGSATLTLEPGTRLEFRPGSQLSVGQLSPGTLRAVGTPARPIVFTSSLAEPIRGAWMGINLEGLAGPDTLLEHVVVAWAGTPAPGGSGGAIRVVRDLGPMIRHALIQGSAACGIRRVGPGAWSTDFTGAALANVFQGNDGPAQCGP